jgi:hypothetical protein
MQRIQRSAEAVIVLADQHGQAAKLVPAATIPSGVRISSVAEPSDDVLGMADPLCKRVLLVDQGGDKSVWLT